MNGSFVNQEIREAYRVAFGSDFGAIVLADLKRIANATKVDARAPNKYSAVYQCAQLALIARITNMIGKNDLDE